MALSINHLLYTAYIYYMVVLDIVDRLKEKKNIFCVIDIH
jgi:hypothetical protein